jgi:uncharacterized protein
MTIDEILHGRLGIDPASIAAFCRRWSIEELSFFGSVLRDDFARNSDVDVLVTFAPAATWTLWDFIDMKDELEKIVGREVDLVSKRALRNPFRREAILRNTRVVYAA